MDKEIIRVLSYFSRFGYPPTLEELHKFLSRKTNRQVLLGNLNRLKRRNIVKFIKLSDEKEYRLSIIDYRRVEEYYTGGEYRKRIKNLEFRIKNYPKRKINSDKKIQKISRFVKVLARFPQIKLVGLSGSVAMLNAEADSDIDLFIITAKNRLWTGRLIAVLLAEIMGIRRRYYTSHSREIGNLYKSINKDKICLNLFFSESEMTVPRNKKTEYVAHEVLQMKPLVNKDRTHEKFLAANSWVKRYFPNVTLRLKINNQKSKLQIKNQKDKVNFLSLICRFSFCPLIFNFFENLLEKLQMYSINKHRTTELISDRQLWFFPDDFEQKLDFRR